MELSNGLNVFPVIPFCTDLSFWPFTSLNDLNILIESENCYGVVLVQANGHYNVHFNAFNDPYSPQIIYDNYNNENPGVTVILYMCSTQQLWKLHAVRTNQGWHYQLFCSICLKTDSPTLPT